MTGFARDWLASAEDDLEFALYALEGGYFAQACFHAHQAAEKAVKAVHHAGGARAVLGHSVRALIERLEPRVDVLDRLIDTTRELDLYYIPTRYPNGLDSGTPREAFSESQAKRAVRIAAAVVEATKQCLAAVRPPSRLT